MKRSLLRYTVIATLLLSTAAVLVHWHGYSLPIWHNYVDGSTQQEVISGVAEPARSDDFDAELPLMLAQGRLDPPFPKVTPLVGFGENAVANAAKLPVLDPVALMRPTLWGYFISGDVGLSFSWVFLTSGLFLATIWSLSLLTDAPAIPVILLAAFHVASPLFHFWSFHYFEVEIFAQVLLCASIRWLLARRRPALLGWGLLSAWATGALALNLYPPFQIPFGYLALTALIGWILAHRSDVARWWQTFGPLWIISSLLLFLATVGAFGLHFYQSAGDILAISARTVYPGHRFSTGGGMGVLRFFLHDYFVGWRIDRFNWKSFGNICEAASGAYLFPVILPWLAIAMFRSGAKQRWPAIVITLFLGWMLYYMSFGIPEFLARWTLFNYATTGRGLAVVDLIDVFLTGLLIGELCRKPLNRKQLAWCGTILACALGMMIYGGFRLRATSDSYLYRDMIYACLIMGVGLLSMLHVRAVTWGLATLVAAEVAASWSFNPVVLGGSDVFAKTALGQTMLKLNGEHGGQSRWLVFSPNFVLADFPRALGLTGFSGTYSYPQAELWRVLDPSGKYETAWNRYAHLTFIPNNDTEPTIVSPIANQIVVYISPTSPKLRQLGIDYILTEGVDLTVFETAKSLSKQGRFDHGTPIAVYSTQATAAKL